MQVIYQKILRKLGDIVKKYTIRPFSPKFAIRSNTWWYIFLKSTRGSKNPGLYLCPCRAYLMPLSKHPLQYMVIPCPWLPNTPYFQWKHFLSFARIIFDNATFVFSCGEINRKIWFLYHISNYTVQWTLYCWLLIVWWVRLWYMYICLEP